MALYFPKPVADSTICVVQVIGDAWDQKVLFYTGTDRK